MYRDFIAAFGDDIDAIVAAAPNDFEVSADEVAGFLSETSAAPQPADEVTFEEPPNSNLAFDPQSGMTIAPAPKSLEPPRESAAAPSVTTGRDMTHAEAVAALHAADAHLTDCRLNVRRTIAAHQEAKGKLQQEIEKYLTNNPNPLTAEMNARLYAQASLDERRQRVLRGAKSGESILARRFVQKRMQGGGPNRGALSQEQRARVGFVVPGSVAATAPFDPQADVRARQGLSAPGKPVLSK
jgi:hypothetical protein